MPIKKITLYFLFILSAAQTSAQRAPATHKAVLTALSFIKKHLKTNSLAVYSKCHKRIGSFVPADIARQYFSDTANIQENYALCDTTNTNAQRKCDCSYFLFAVTPGPPTNFKYTAFFSPYYENTMIVQVVNSGGVLYFNNTVAFDTKNYFYVFKFSKKGKLRKKTKYYAHLEI